MDQDEKRAQNAAYMRAYMARMKAAETPEHREARLAKKRESDHRRRADKEAFNAKQRAWRAGNREQYLATRREWYSRNREAAYLANLDAGKRYRMRVRLAALRHYGGDVPVCRCCGESIIEFLCLDHIDGGGNAHRKEVGVRSMYEWLRKNEYPDGLFQVLCHNCNMAKGFYGACPHGGYFG